jgi:arginyl-tRNA synthetase
VNQLYRNVQSLAIELVENASNDLGWEIPGEIKFDEPPNPAMGDLATSISFQLAKKYGKNPLDIAKEITDKITIIKQFRKVESKGPYINFYINYQNYLKDLSKALNKEYGKLRPNDQKMIIEHTSANPNGPLHIGHIRNSIIGDCLSRICRYAGWNVETQYYVNDMGRQIAMVVWGVLNLNYEMDPYGKSDHEIGKLYFQVNQELKKNPEIKSEIDYLLKKYEQYPDLEIENSFENVVNACLDGVKDTSYRLGIEHDSYIWESHFIRNGSVQEVLDDLEPLLEKNEVVYLDLNEYGIEKELILIRSDGTSLYTTRDIAYHLEKSNESDVSIDVLGSDHKLALDQLKIVMDILDGKRPEVIFYEFITLPEGSMSTRRGIFISVDELLDEAVSRAIEELKARRPELEDAEMTDIAEMIGVGAVRYYIARLSPEKHLVFKWDDALSFERGCASIQYAHARACKLLEKAENFIAEDVDWDDLKVNNLDILEIKLVKIIAKFSYVIENSARERKVHTIAQYALDLSGAFNKFYKSVQVIGSDNEKMRLFLVDAARITIRNALDLLGISAPETM